MTLRMNDFTGRRWDEYKRNVKRTTKEGCKRNAKKKNLKVKKQDLIMTRTFRRRGRRWDLHVLIA